MKIPYAMALLFWDCTKWCYDQESDCLFGEAPILFKPILFKPILFKFDGLELAGFIKRRGDF
jgi:hypothetical protein